MDAKGIIRHDRNRYLVKSNTSEHNHEITRNGDEFECSCKWEEWRLIRGFEKRCNHIQLLKKIFNHTRKHVLDVLDMYEDEFPNLSSNPHLIVLLIYKIKYNVKTLDELFKLYEKGEIIKAATVLRCVRQLKEKGIIKDLNKEERYENAEMYRTVFAEEAKDKGQTVWF